MSGLLSHLFYRIPKKTHIYAKNPRRSLDFCAHKPYNKDRKKGKGVIPMESQKKKPTGWDVFQTLLALIALIAETIDIIHHW